MSHRLFLVVVVALPLVALAAAVWYAPRAWRAERSEPFVRDPAGWATSDTCLPCHQDHHASWYRTFHRTMTQEATPATVVGEFDGRDVTYWGLTVRPVRRGDRFYFEYRHPESGALLRTLEIERTVGSRRYQQYLARTPETGENYFRLHLLWHIGDRRWVHMNGAFLGPDDQPFDANVATWNHGCIFCHNTGPQPGSTNYTAMMARARDGAEVDFVAEARYDSEVAELGIACESCHGPAEEHVVRNRNPLRRYYLHVTGADDPTIVDPGDLSPERAADLCGQCHGQRVPLSMQGFEDWITSGPTFRAGDDLEDHVEPIFAHTTGFVGPDEDRFRLRFWNDGTPRLTAYEYQGLELSPCFREGELTCISCHAMHGGDVYGQIEPAMRTDAACASCHGELVRDAAEHSGHPAGTVSCYDCHMPQMVYGIMEIHRSHRIENPAPAAHAARGRPDACTNCHVGGSTEWAARAAAEIWGGRPPATIARGDGAPAEVAGSVAALLAGDPVQRAVAARLAGRPDAPGSARERAFLVPALLLALDDSYPAVRRFAQKSLESLDAQLAAEGFAAGVAEPLAGFDFIAPAAERRAVVAELARAWAAAPRGALPPPPPGSLVRPDYLPERAATTALQALAARSDKRIDIGE